jgi:hypothetical protein
MSTHRTSWKRRERNAARLFGAQRQVLSGSCGRGERGRSDTTHDRLFIETKLRASSSVRSLWERTRELARRESKIPVLMLYAKGKPGGLVVVHESDLAAVAPELGDDWQATRGAYAAREEAMEERAIDPSFPDSDLPGGAGQEHSP